MVTSSCRSVTRSGVMRFGPPGGDMHLLLQQEARLDDEHLFQQGENHRVPLVAHGDRPLHHAVDGHACDRPPPPGGAARRRVPRASCTVLWMRTRPVSTRRVCTSSASTMTGSTRGGSRGIGARAPLQIGQRHGHSIAALRPLGSAIWTGTSTCWPLSSDTSTSARLPSRGQAAVSMVPWTPWGSVTVTAVGGFIPPPSCRRAAAGYQYLVRTSIMHDQDDEDHHSDPDHPRGGATGGPPQALIHPDAPSRCVKTKAQACGCSSLAKVDLLRSEVSQAISQ